MQKILLLTDLHLRTRGKTIIGLDPAARLGLALEQALGDHPDAEALILMGDLTHSGKPEEYSALRNILASCTIPVIFMMGNHDARAPFYAEFPDAPKTPQGHVQHIVDLPDHRIITLDTLDENADPHHSGVLCTDRLAWLQAALNSTNGRMPLVFAHHPPCDIGLPGMDAIGLRNGSDLLALLENKGAHLFCGHVHRTISGQANGIPYAIFKSTCHQAPLDLEAPDSTLSIAEPAAYGLLLLGPNTVTVHSEDIGLNLPSIAGNDALPETEPS
ncbi:phosphodiesterase [Octadecabacter sp. G9-8]|uniref:Phosphodiesterase n=1 Tax=Octadecabacter dasysiphoniae TaxID=2909341 RepID=A0ABS9CUU1_9RHOB|nr:phosphodiesterase [Octadecabacter dasysiphoniae]MCF2870180.1 phosphodiesterase [Octadecabacter dasysiphoniae]